MKEFDFFSTETGKALDYILKNWHPEKENFEEFRNRIIKMSNYQPERSKREDSCPVDHTWPSDHIWCGCPECGECSCKRCGALSTVVTS